MNADGEGEGRRVVAEEAADRGDVDSALEPPRPGGVEQEPGEDEGPVKALEPGELAALIEAVPDDWRRLLVRVLAGPGLRRSEALGLRWSDVDGAAFGWASESATAGWAR